MTRVLLLTCLGCCLAPFGLAGAALTIGYLLQLTGLAP